MENISDEILRQAACGDISAFEEIYKKTSGMVFTVAYRVTNNREAAAEVTQDVFMKVHRSLGSFMFRSSFKTWLYRVTVNTALNAVQKARIERDKTVGLDGVEFELGIRPGQRDKVARDDAAVSLDSFLARLNEKQRACVILREIEGLSYKEIARAIDTNINTVRSILKRAREALLRMGSERGEDNGLPGSSRTHNDGLSGRRIEPAGERSA